MNFQSFLRIALLFVLLLLSACAHRVTWIDVRSPEEFSQKHVPAAINIPYDQIGSDITALSLEKDQDIYLYCVSGRRAGIATETLSAMGYTSVVNIGGLDEALAEAEKSRRK
jgi:phage shock protein E